jgi:hypothetical protein
VLINLTGGVALRLNPTIVNDRENIFYYLKRAYEKRIMIAIAGAELIFVSYCCFVKLSNNFYLI